MKRLIKKLLRKFERSVVYYTSEKVLAAINAGKSYDEVMAIVDEEIEKQWPQK